MNIVQLWLLMLKDGKDIGTLSRTRILYESNPRTPICPTVTLFTQEGSDRLYADPKWRPALDAWDVGKVNSYDIARWAKYIMEHE